MSTAAASPEIHARSTIRGTWRVPRREVRRPHRAPCVIRVEGSEGEALSGRTVNISKSGLAMHCGEKLPVGTRVEVMLPKSGDEMYSLFGRVVHARRIQAEAFEIGVSLTKPGSVWSRAER